MNIFYLLGMIPEPFYSLLTKIGNFMFLCKKPEKIHHLGDNNKDKTFYVISNLAGGLAGQYDSALGYIARANKKGWIPYIDLEKSSNPVLIDPLQIEKNPWKYYFDEPCQNYSITEILNSANVVFCNSNLHMIYKRYNKWNVSHRFSLSKYVPLRKEIMKSFDEDFGLLFPDYMSEKIVGVYYRGTDYKNVGTWAPSGHATVPEIEVFCNDLEKDIKRWNCNKLFFMTEEQEALDYFISRFPDVKFVAKERFENFKYGITIAAQTPNNTSRFENNRLYLLDIYILSKCNYIVGTLNGGVLMALNWNNNKYDDVHILNYGVTK